MGPLFSSCVFFLACCLQCNVGRLLLHNTCRGRKHWSFRLRCRACLGLPCTPPWSPSLLDGGSSLRMYTHARTLTVHVHVLGIENTIKELVREAPWYHKQMKKRMENDWCTQGQNVSHTEKPWRKKHSYGFWCCFRRIDVWGSVVFCVMCEVQGV